MNNGLFATFKAIFRSGRALVRFVLCAVLLVMTAVPIGSDIWYLLRSHETDAAVTKVQQRARSRRVEYQFTEDDGTPRTGTDTAPVGWEKPATGMVAVQYIPGADGSSRLSRYITHWLPYALFPILGIILLWTIWRAARGVARAVQPPM